MFKMETTTTTTQIYLEGWRANLATINDNFSHIVGYLINLDIIFATLAINSIMIGLQKPK